MTLNKIYENINKHHPVRIYELKKLALPPTGHSPTAHRLGLKFHNCRYTSDFHESAFLFHSKGLNVSLGFWNLMLYFRCVMSERTSALWLTLKRLVFFESFRILPLKSRVKHTPEYIMVRSKCSNRIKTCSNGTFIFLRNHWNLSQNESNFNGFYYISFSKLFIFIT